MQVLGLKEGAENQIVSQAVSILSTGGLVIYPTETAYGIAAKANSHRALEKLMNYKGDRKSPISVAVNSIEMAKHFVSITPMAENLYKKYLPGPLTIISTAFDTVDPILKAETGTLGIRIPDFPLILKIIYNLDDGITATSANISGGKTPYSLKEYIENTSEEKIQMIDLFIDAGPLSGDLPSTVVKTIGKLEIIRQGEIIPSIP